MLGVALHCSLNVEFDMDCRDYLDRAEAARFLSEHGYPIAKATLDTMAVRGGGPPYCYWGRKPLYRKADLLAWAQGRISPPVASTSAAPSCATPTTPQKCDASDKAQRHFSSTEILIMEKTWPSYASYPQPLPAQLLQPAPTLYTRFDTGKPAYDYDRAWFEARASTNGTQLLRCFPNEFDHPYPIVQLPPLWIHVIQIEPGTHLAYPLYRGDLRIGHDATDQSLTHLVEYCWSHGGFDPHGLVEWRKRRDAANPAWLRSDPPPRPTWIDNSSGTPVVNRG